MLKSYAIGDDVLCQSVPSSLNLQPSYFLYDGHGSTRLLTDAQGDVTAQYAYDSYGVMLGQTAGAQAKQATDLLYSGERYDSALQLYYLRARRYNPANGQFTSLDPYSGSPHDPQSLHKYAYCHTDPVNGIDPSGEMIISLTQVYVAIGISATISIAVNLSGPTTKSIPRILGEAVLAGVAGAIAVPVSAIALAIASAGAWGLLIAAIMLGGISWGVELANQALFDKKIDKAKLWVAFIAGCLFGGAIARYGITDKASKVVTELILPYFQGLVGVVGGMSVDGIRSVRTWINSHTEYLDINYEN